METKRKLAVILFADIAGYTSLMQKDEAKALSILNKFKSELENLVFAQNGEVIQFYGDGCLVIFDSAVDAVNCAMLLQKSFQTEPNVPVRMGLHVGDIVVEAENVFGDAVNIASRIESLGVPGAILLSSSVRNQIKNKTAYQLTSLGRFEFKNVEGSMSVYAIQNDGFVVPNRKDLSGKLKTKSTKSKKKIQLFIGVFAVIILIGLVYWLLPRDGTTQSQEGYDAIAVFPFDVNGSADIQYLGAGMVDLISTKLDEVPEINTIDPNLIFYHLKSKSEIGRDIEKAARLSLTLDANKFIMGSIVEVEEEIQITAFKYDATGKSLEEITVKRNQSTNLPQAVDDLVRQLIAKEMTEKGHELSGLGAITTQNMESLKAYLQGEQAFRSGDVVQAFDYFSEAVQLDSTFALAWMRIIDADAWDITKWVPNAYENWKKYRHKLPKKWQEYQDAFLLYVEGNRKARPAFEKLIRKYGESRAFNMGLGEFLFHFNPVYGKSESESIPYFLKTLELDPHNIEAFGHLTDIARNQKDTATILKMLALLDEDSEIYTQIKINELVLKDSVSDAEIEAYLNHPHFQQIHAFRIFGTLDDGTINKDLIKKLTELYDNEFFKLVSKTFLSSLSGEENRVYVYLEKQGELMPDFFVPLDKYRRCLPATFMVNNEFFPMANRYAELFEELKGKDTPWEIYAAIKYAMALDKTNEVPQLKAQLLDKSLNPDLKKEALYYHYSIKAFEAYLENNNDLTLTYIDSAYQHSYGYWEIQAACYDKTIMQANIFAERGEFDKAISFFENLPGFFGYEYIHGYTLYKLSDWYEQTDNPKGALKKCNLLLEYYQNCDEKYKPWVEETQKRRDRIISKMN